jgi:nitrilase
MNGARQALIECGQHVHADAWPALSTMAGFEGAADAQIEALMKNHVLTAQVFVVCASNPVDQTCLEWMQQELGEQGYVKEGGGWSAIIRPLCFFLGGPHTGKEEKLVVGEIDLEQLGAVKVSVDAAGHYKRPEVLSFQTNRKMIWDDEKLMRGTDDERHDEDVVEKAVDQGEAKERARDLRGVS